MSAKSANRTPVHFTIPRGLAAPHCSRNVCDTRGSFSRSEKCIVPASLREAARVDLDRDLPVVELDFRRLAVRVRHISGSVIGPASLAGCSGAEPSALSGSGAGKPARSGRSTSVSGHGSCGAAACAASRALASGPSDRLASVNRR